MSASKRMERGRRPDSWDCVVSHSFRLMGINDDLTRGILGPSQVHKKNLREFRVLMVGDMVDHQVFYLLFSISQMKQFLDLHLDDFFLMRDHHGDGIEKPFLHNISVKPFV